MFLRFVKFRGASASARNSANTSYMLRRRTTNFWRMAAGNRMSQVFFLLHAIAALLAICEAQSLQSPGDAVTPTPQSMPACPRIQIGCAPPSACTSSGDDNRNLIGIGEPQGRISIVCAVSGTNSPSVAWRSDIQQDLAVRTVAGLSVLSLDRLRSDVHNTTYHCLGSAECGTAMASVSLNIVGEPPHTAVLTPRIERYVGEYAQFRCHVDGSPAPIIRWTNVFQHNVMENGRFRLQADGSLLVSHLTMEDNGVYFCNAENRHGRSSASVTLTVRVIPAVTVNYSEAAQLECAIAGIPVPFVSWHRVVPGELGDIVQTEVVGIGRVYSLSFARKEDAGVYACNVSSQYGVAIDKAELIVIGEKPTSDVDPDVLMEVSNGQRITLSCGNVHGIPTPSVEWTSRVETPQHSLERRTTRIGNDVIFASVQHADKGQYICTAVNKLGNTTITINLLVYDGFVTGRPTRPQHAMAGSRLELDCPAVSPTNQPLSFSWFWSTDRLEKMSRATPVALSEAVQLQHGKLVFLRPSLDQAGMYWCKAEDTVAVPWRMPAEVFIYGTPEVLLTVPGTVFMSSGGSLDIPCYVAGYPAPTVEWRDRYGMLVKTHQQHGSSLVIDNFSPGDSGNYTCTAWNRIRSTVRRASTMVTVLLADTQPRFFGQSYAAYPALPWSFMSFTLEFSFRTTHINLAQLLVINTQSNDGRGRQDFVAVYLSGGRVHAVVDAGQGSVALTHQTTVNPNNWYTVRVAKQWQTVVLNIGTGSEVRMDLPSHLYGLSLTEPLYVGGHPDMARVERLLPDGVSNGLRGCIRDVLSQGRALDLRDDVVASHQTGQCGAWCSEQCDNGGQCLHGMADPADHGVRQPACACQQPYRGARCEISVSTHKLCSLLPEECATLGACQDAVQCIAPIT